MHFQVNTSKRLQHVIIPYSYEGQIQIHVKNLPEQNILSKRVDIDIDHIPLNEIALNTINRYAVKARHNYTINLISELRNESLPYVLRGTWQRRTYFKNGQIFAGFGDSETVQQKHVNYVEVSVFTGFALNRITMFEFFFFFRLSS